MPSERQNDGQNYCPKYCQYYCEENIWHLCQSSSLPHVPRFVVTVGNHLRRVLLWSQKLASNEETPICWDYHMVLLAKQTGQPWVIYDLDTSCEFPSSAERYLDRTFRSLPIPWNDCAPQFRLIPAKDYLSCFHSDRAHMRKPDGTWIYPPPKWSEILSNNKTRYVLSELTDFQRVQPGWIGDLQQFRSKLASTMENETKS